MFQGILIPPPPHLQGEKGSGGLTLRCVAKMRVACSCESIQTGVTFESLACVNWGSQITSTGTPDASPNWA